MATLGKNYITFRDINSGRLPDGTMDRDIVELMARENPALDDILFKQCSHGREDITTIRTGIPEAAWRAYYEGVQGAKSSKKQVANACGTLSTAIEFDARLYEDTDDKAAFLLDEAEASAEGMGQAAAAALFYGDIKNDPKGINGLAKVFSLATGNNTDQDESAHYVFNAMRGSNSSAAMLRSIFLVGWGKKAICGLYPKGADMGLKRGKLEFHYTEQSDGKKLKMGIQELNWNLGLNVKDFRYGGRIANIELDKAFDASGVPDYVELLMRLQSRVKQEGVTTRFYMSRLAFEALETQFYRKTMGNAVQYADMAQRMPASIRGIPVGLCDAMELNETQVPVKS